MISLNVILMRIKINKRTLLSCSDIGISISASNLNWPCKIEHIYIIFQGESFRFFVHDQLLFSFRKYKMFFPFIPTIFSLFVCFSSFCSIIADLIYFLPHFLLDYVCLLPYQYIHL
jgi:hypothetical protein